MNISIKYDEKKLRASIDGIGKMTRELHGRMYQATQDSIMDVHATTVKSGYAPYRTGTLRRSLTMAIASGTNEVVGAVGTNLVYARIHEFGGRTGRNHSVTILPKRYLSRAVKDNEKKIQDRFQKYLAINRII